MGSIPGAPFFFSFFFCNYFFLYVCLSSFVFYPLSLTLQDTIEEVAVPTAVFGAAAEKAAQLKKEDKERGGGGMDDGEGKEEATRANSAKRFRRK